MRVRWKHRMTPQEDVKDEKHKPPASSLYSNGVHYEPFSGCGNSLRTVSVLFSGDKSIALGYTARRQCCKIGRGRITAMGTAWVLTPSLPNIRPIAMLSLPRL